jgi:UDP-glucuronate decarboxylase
MKTVMVTGAAGFLGSHLMLHHLKQGDAVLGIDNYCSSDPDSLHVNEIKNFKTKSCKFLFECDVTERGFSGLDGCINDFKRCNDDKQFDIIYNFACPASPPRYQAMPIKTMMTCTLGVKNILDIAMQMSSIVVHASTSEVYGDPDVSPQPEQYRGNVNSYGPRACYDEGKRAAEALCFDYLHRFDVDARMVRIFNTYGPHMSSDDGRVISNFICQALNNEKLTLYGEGQQTRSFCYVDDLIAGIVAMGNLGQNPNAPINLGNPNEFTIRELAENVVRKLGATDDAIKYGSLFEYEKLPTDDPTQRCPNIARARELLLWEPRVQLSEGLDKTIEYFRHVCR